MIKNTISRQISQKCHQLFAPLLARSAISVLQTAVKLTGTSAQAEEFSVYFLPAYTSD